MSVVSGNTNRRQGRMLRSATVGFGQFPMQRPQDDRRREKEPGAGDSLLEEVGKVMHGYGVISHSDNPPFLQTA